MCVHLSRKNKLCLFTCLGRRALEHTLPPIMQLCQSQLPSVFTHTSIHENDYEYIFTTCLYEYIKWLLCCFERSYISTT